MTRTWFVWLSIVAAVPAWAQGHQYSIMPDRQGEVGWCNPAPPVPVVVTQEVIREVKVSVPGPESIIVKEVPVPAPVAITVPLPTWDVFFAFDQSTPLAKCKEKLDQIADYLKTHPARTAVLSGHADVRTQVGHGYNTRLADRRVKAVMEALAARGVPAGRVRPTSFGDALPVIAADTCPPKQPGRTTPVEEEKCQQDRRVEVFVK